MGRYTVKVHKRICNKQTTEIILSTDDKVLADNAYTGLVVRTRYDLRRLNYKEETTLTKSKFTNDKDYTVIVIEGV